MDGILSKAEKAKAYWPDIENFSMCKDVQKIDVYRTMLQDWIVRENVHCHTLLWNMLTRYNNQIPIGKTDDAKKMVDTNKSQAILAHFVAERAQLWIFDCGLMTRISVCWMYGCKNEGGTNKYLTCDECCVHNAQGLLKNLTTIRYEPPPPGNFIIKHKIIGANAWCERDTYMSVAVRRTLNALVAVRKFLGYKQTPPYEHWSEDQERQTEQHLAYNEVFEYEGVSLSYSHKLNAILFRGVDDEDWSRKCKKTGCPSATIVNNVDKCKKHDTRMARDIIWTSIMELAEIHDWSEMSFARHDIVRRNIELRIGYDPMICGHKTIACKINDNLKIGINCEDSIRVIQGNTEYARPTRYNICENYGKSCQTLLRSNEDCKNCHSLYWFTPNVSYNTEKNEIFLRRAFNKPLPAGFNITHQQNTRLFPDYASSALNGYVLMAAIESNMMGLQGLTIKNFRIKIGPHGWIFFRNLLQDAGLVLTITDSFDEEGVREDEQLIQFLVENSSKESLDIIKNFPTVYISQNIVTKRVYIGHKRPYLYNGNRKNCVVAACHVDEDNDGTNYRKILEDGEPETNRYNHVIAAIRKGREFECEAILTWAHLFGQQILDIEVKVVNDYIFCNEMSPTVFFSELRRAIYFLYGKSFTITRKPNGLFHPIVIKRK